MRTWWALGIYFARSTAVLTVGLRSSRVMRWCIAILTDISTTLMSLFHRFYRSLEILLRFQRKVKNHILCPVNPCYLPSCVCQASCELGTSLIEQPHIIGKLTEFEVEKLRHAWSAVIKTTLS